MALALTCLRLSLHSFGEPPPQCEGALEEAGQEGEVNGSVAKLALRVQELWSHLPNSAVVKKWVARERELRGPLPLAPSPLIGRWTWLQICEASEVSLPPPRELPPVPPASPMLALQACLPPPKESSPVTPSARKRPKAAVESEKSAQSKLPCRFTRLGPMGAPRPLPLALGPSTVLALTAAPRFQPLGSPSSGPRPGRRPRALRAH